LIDEHALSVSIEALLVARNPRNMQVARDSLESGYYLRAAQRLRNISGNVVIGTGFPVTDTFETDGPVGAIALYQCLEQLGAHPIIACGPLLGKALEPDYNILQLRAEGLAGAREEAAQHIRKLKPSAIIAIERPGLAADGRYYNMRGDDISGRCFYFDAFIEKARCPTIGIGDGGNEIGMGNIAHALEPLDITPSVTRCDELLVADVSNWAAYGLISFLALWSGRDLLQEAAPLQVLNYLSGLGSVDGVTGANTLTEDGLDAAEGMRIIDQLRQLTGFTQSQGEQTKLAEQASND